MDEQVNGCNSIEKLYWHNGQPTCMGKYTPSDRFTEYLNVSVSSWRRRDEMRSSGRGIPEARVARRMAYRICASESP